MFIIRSQNSQGIDLISKKAENVSMLIWINNNRDTIGIICLILFLAIGIVFVFTSISVMLFKKLFDYSQQPITYWFNLFLIGASI